MQWCAVCTVHVDCAHRHWVVWRAVLWCGLYKGNVVGLMVCHVASERRADWKYLKLGGLYCEAEVQFHVLHLHTRSCCPDAGLLFGTWQHSLLTFSTVRSPDYNCYVSDKRGAASTAACGVFPSAAPTKFPSAFHRPLYTHSQPTVLWPTQQLYFVSAWRPSEQVPRVRARVEQLILLSHWCWI